MADGIKLIVGLGNPGVDYAKTRHNVGMWFVDAIAAEFDETFKKEAKFFGFFRKTSTYCLLIPTTFMNDSGKAVAAVAKFYKISPTEILVVHDELDFPVGQVRLKSGGGHGGHNGLRDIIQHLGSNNFYRLRIGIDHPGHKDRVTPYVLSAPNKKDREEIMLSINLALRLIPDLIAGKFQKVMRELH